MDKNDVILEISIDYKTNIYSQKSTELISLEELKTISKEKFNISDEDMKIYIFKTKDNNINIKNDTDLVSNMIEIDEYNYKINLSLTENEVIIERKKKMKKICCNLDEKIKNLEEKKNKKALKKNLFFWKIINEENKLKEEYENKKKQLKNKITNYKDDEPIVEKKPNKNILLDIKKINFFTIQGIVEKKQNNLNDKKLPLKLDEKNNDKEINLISFDENKYQKSFNEQLDNNYNNLKNNIIKLIETNNQKILKNYHENILSQILTKLQELNKRKTDKLINDQNAEFPKENNTPLGARNYPGNMNKFN